jgi:hypothetical protein
MLKTIQADQNGVLVLPATLTGPLEPGTKFSVERRGGVIIVRPELSEAERWYASTTPAQRVAQFDEWVRNMPLSSAPPLPPEATRRDSMYE